MEIEKAQELGLCFGIRRAVKLLKEAVNKYGQIETLGPVAHNQQLVQELSEAGIKMANDLDQVQGKILAIPTHGVSPKVLSDIKARKIRIIDTTCPIVHKAQNVAKELAEAGFYVLIFGEAKHSEVKGLLGWANDRGMATLDVKQIVITEEARQSLSPYHVGIISQTTQSHSAFVEFTTQLISTFAPKLEEVHIVNTLCGATRRRQEAAIKLARRNELIIVVGGHNSANTRHLAEACSPIVETHLVENSTEVDSSWLAGKHCIGITAGASTPNEAIDEVIAKLKPL
jgi:4-hydroxy-3-methylbut-2-enyl diphosphate reductase